MASQINRYEINQRVSSVMVRNAVDTTRVNHSCAGNSLHLFGRLVKDPSGEFSASQVEVLFRELASIPGVLYIQAELDNWSVEGDCGSFHVHRRQYAGGGEAGDTLEIDGKESYREVLSAQGKSKGGEG